MVAIGDLYEHPQWFEPLFAEFDRRTVPFERIHADRLSNFVADAPEVVGFDPFVNLVDFIINEASRDPRNFPFARENELAI